MPDYQDFLAAQRFQKVIALSADGSMIAYSTDTSGQFNLWIQPVAGGAARPLTSFTEQAVREIAWSPNGSRIAFTADTHGDEQTQVFVIEVDGGAMTLLSEAGDRQFTLAEKTAFDASGRYLLCCGNDRDRSVPDLIVYDLYGGPPKRYVGFTDGHVFALAISPDARRLLAGAITSNTDCKCCVVNLDGSGVLEVVTDRLPGHYFYPCPWNRDASGFYVRTAVNGGFVSLGCIALPDPALMNVDTPGWDVEDVVVSADGGTIIWSVNEDGRSVLYCVRDGQAFDLPRLPDGAVQGMSISADGALLALMINTPSRPLQPAVMEIAAGASVRFLTDPRPSALRSAAPVVPELCHYPARDGTTISAQLYRPAGPGPHPVVLSIHGGPEQQARPTYEALNQVLLASGIAVFEPNVHGSTGYGHEWQTRIYRDWGGIDLDDFEAAADYIRAQDWADPGRLAVMGRSYGGFAALSCVTRLPEIWAAGVSIYGPANLETFARSIPPEWVSLVHQMFGDLDKDAEKLRLRSPITYADQITAPLLVIQGANDARVPKGESDQIVDKARDNGVSVEYLVFGDEGHGFTNRDNDIAAHAAIVGFLVEHIGIDSPNSVMPGSKYLRP